MISGATYKNGIALNGNGAAYIASVPSGAVPTPNAPCKGTNINPPAKALSLDGAIYVRFV
jgi:hypothetical protein